MYCIGLTGTISSGKSTVAKYFEALGIEVINADALARALTAKDEPALNEIVKYFGEKILKVDGELDRTQLKQRIFRQPNDRLWLEQLLHPLIRQRIESLIQHCQSPYSIIEIPLLYDRTAYPYLKRVLVVTSPPELQIARAIERDGESREQILTILATQPSSAHFHALADDIIVNDGTLAALKTKVEKLHRFYLTQANDG